MTEDRGGPMQIRLTRHARGDWTVVCGDKYHAQLAPDEAAWIVMNLMVNGDGGRLGIHTIQDEMARLSRSRHGDKAIDRMNEIMDALRDDQRHAHYGPTRE